MALSEDENLEYTVSDDELTTANAVIMPEGTTTYTLSSGHTVVTVRKVGDSYMIRSNFSAGTTDTITVQPGDVVWDLNEMKYYLKYSTGGNSFVNFINVIESVDSGESDGMSMLLWNGGFKIL